MTGRGHSYYFVLPIPEAPTHSGTIARVKVGRIIELLESDGWFLAVTRGSHRQFKHPTKPGRVTVAGRLSSDLHPKTQASILRQAGLKR
jgi:predicted RNA binding protein YcfA (HicA-like mRNA interferase family)